MSGQGITLTDNARKLFFRKHYNVNQISHCGVDPEDRRFDLSILYLGWCIWYLIFFFYILELFIWTLGGTVYLVYLATISAMSLTVDLYLYSYLPWIHISIQMELEVIRREPRRSKQAFCFCRTQGGLQSLQPGHHQHRHHLHHRRHYRHQQKHQDHAV